MLKYLSIVLVLIFGLNIGSAAAHRPYYTQVMSFMGPNEQRVAIKLLHGDGIFFADPIRAVIVDENGKLLAASPMSTSLFISCRHVDSGNDCVVYDETRRLLYKPNQSLWKITALLEHDGKPQIYPEDWMEEYAFDTRQASIFEIVKFETLSIIARPLPTVIAIIWWTGIWSIITPLFWRLKKNRWRVERKSVNSILLILLRLFGTSILILLTAYLWLLEPYSVIYFIVVTFAGVISAMVLTKPRSVN